MPETLLPEIEVRIDSDRRLLVSSWTNEQSDKTFVSVAPQWLDRLKNWRLSHSGLLLLPAAARQLAPALLEIADAIEAGERP